MKLFVLIRCSSPSVDRRPAGVRRRVRADRHRRRLPRRLSGRGRRRQRRRPPDVIGARRGTCAWYENPTWKKRIVSTGEADPGIISSATADLDGDGKAEIAIAYEFVDERADEGRANAGDSRGRIRTAPGRSSRSPTSAASTGCGGGDIGTPRTRALSPSTRSATWSSRRSSGPRPGRRPSTRSRPTCSFSTPGRSRSRVAGRRRPSATPRSCTRSRFDFDRDGRSTVLGGRAIWA